MVLMKSKMRRCGSLVSALVLFDVIRVTCVDPLEFAHHTCGYRRTFEHRNVAGKINLQPLVPRVVSPASNIGFVEVRRSEHVFRLHLIHVP